MALEILRPRNDKLMILGIGVSPHQNDGAIRFAVFCERYGLEYKVLGEGKVWQGGSMHDNTGGGQKIIELLDAIKEMDNRLIVFCDTFDLFPIAGEKEIVEKYHRLCPANEVLCTAEVFCWPDSKLSEIYPQTETKYRFLNSGGIIGYRDDIYRLIVNANIKHNDDDQLYFTHKYLDIRPDSCIRLDHTCEIFQTLCGVTEDIHVSRGRNHHHRICNTYTGTFPVFIHGNGEAKTHLNHLENYLDTNPKFTDSTSFVSQILENPQPVLDNQSLPHVFCALYIDSSQPLHLKTFLRAFLQIDYSTKTVYLYDRTGNSDTELVALTLNAVYRPHIQGYYFDDFRKSDCDYYFALEQNCVMTNPLVLKKLVVVCNQHHRVISPLLSKKEDSLVTNFWGAVDGNGYYAQSSDYVELAKRAHRGIWNCMYVRGAILMEKSIVRDWDLHKANRHQAEDYDMQLCYNLRRFTIFMYMMNVDSYGYLAY